MYNLHVPKITKNAFNDVDYNLAVIQFTLHTIRRQFYMVSADNRLMGVQKEGLDYAKSNKNKLHALIHSSLPLEDKIIGLMDIKGLNIVKSSFILQMTGHDIGCIDSHNAKRMGVDSNSLVMDKSRKIDRSKIWKYIGMCHSKEMGGACNMWDIWCEGIADSYKGRYQDAYDVSNSHLTLISNIYESNKNGTSS